MFEVDLSESVETCAYTLYSLAGHMKHFAVDLIDRYALVVVIFTANGGKLVVQRLLFLRDVQAIVLSFFI